MRLADHILCSVFVDADISRDEVIRLLLDRLAAAGRLDRADLAALESAVLRRERLGSTGIGCGVAMPHAMSELVRQGVAALAVLRRPIEFASLDGEPVDLVLLQLAPPLRPGMHLGSAINPLAVQLMRCFSRAAFRDQLRAAESPEAIAGVFELAETGAFDATA